MVIFLASDREGTRCAIKGKGKGALFFCREAGKERNHDNVVSGKKKKEGAVFGLRKRERKIGST